MSKFDAAIAEVVEVEEAEEATMPTPLEVAQREIDALLETIRLSSIAGDMDIVATAAEELVSAKRLHEKAFKEANQGAISDAVHELALTIKDKIKELDLTKLLGRPVLDIQYHYEPASLGSSNEGVLTVGLKQKTIGSGLTSESVVRRIQDGVVETLKVRDVIEKYATAEEIKAAQTPNIQRWAVRLYPKINASLGFQEVLV